MYTLERPERSRAVSTHNLLARQAEAAWGEQLAAAHRRGVHPLALVIVIALLRMTLGCKNKSAHKRNRRTQDVPKDHT
jgi:hypothetical protein